MSVPTNKELDFEFDFENMTLADLKNYDLTNPKLLKKLNIDPVPIFESTDVHFLYKQYRELYIICILKLNIFEMQREIIYDKLKKVTPTP